MSNLMRLGVLLLVASALVGVGCRGKQPAAPAESKSTEGPLLTPPQQSAPTTSKDGQAALPTESEPNGKQNPTATESVDAAKIKANLASLSIADRTLAEKQKICPVSGEPLGGMGPPKKITVAGREVFICCPACEDPLNKEPAKYFAKIGLEPAK